MRPSALLVALALPLPGCLSSLAPPEPAAIRWYSAAPWASAAVEAAAPAGAEAHRPRLRLRRVTAAAHLEQRMVWRGSDVEYGFHETLRWTEPPVAWLEQGLARALFERGGLRRSGALTAPALDVRLEAFEEVLRPERRAVVSVAVDLYGPDGDALLSRTLTHAEPLGGSSPARVAAATARALEALLADVAAQVQEELAPETR